MKKILKRVTAMCCATIMAASMMTMDAGAYRVVNGFNDIEKPTYSKHIPVFGVTNLVASKYADCYGKISQSKNKSKNGYVIKSYASTGLTKPKGGAAISTAIYYNKSLKSKAVSKVGNGNGGQSGASTQKSVNVSNKSQVKYARNIHDAYGYIVFKAQVEL